MTSNAEASSAFLKVLLLHLNVNGTSILIFFPGHSIIATVVEISGGIRYFLVKVIMKATVCLKATLRKDSIV